MREIWKDVPSFEGYYQASNLGRIRTVDRIGPTCYGATRKLKGRVVAVNGGKRGYLRVSSHKYGVMFAHRLVAMAWVPNPHGLPVINHIDGNKSNNIPSNLEWCTQPDNVRHGFRTGLTPIKILQKGDKSIAAKLTEEKVALIKRRIINGERAVDLAKEYWVGPSTIAELKAGRSWGHVNAANS